MYAVVAPLFIGVHDRLGVRLGPVTVAKGLELAAYGLLGKEAPPYVALPALPVSKVSVLEAWESVYHTPPPPELVEAAT